MKSLVDRSLPVTLSTLESIAVARAEPSRAASAVVAMTKRSPSLWIVQPVGMSETLKLPAFVIISKRRGLADIPPLASVRVINRPKRLWSDPAENDTFIAKKYLGVSETPICGPPFSLELQTNFTAPAGTDSGPFTPLSELSAMTLFEL